MSMFVDGSRVDDADLSISAITVREVSKGIAKLRAKKPESATAIQQRFDIVLEALDERVLPISREIAALWGMLLARSDKHIDDTGLAATARVHGLVVATRNVEHFSGREVSTLNPYKPSVSLP